MAIQTDEVRDLAGFAPEGLLVTTFYLNVDATEFPSPQSIHKSVDSLLHTGEMALKERSSDPQRPETLSHVAKESIRQDLQKIEQYVKRDFKRVDTNGLAIFSCSAAGFWHVFQLPGTVESQVEFSSIPYLAPIAEFLSHTKPTAILVVDRQQARIITMSKGDVKEWTSFEDWVPCRSDQGGWSQMRYQRRSDNWARHHVDHAAELVLKLEEHYPFDWLILGSEVEVQHDLEHDLHPYVKDRLIGHIAVRSDAPTDEIVEKARRVREEAEERLIDDLVRKIQEYAGAGGRGTIGLDRTLQALNEQKVHILLVQAGYTHPGSICICGMLFSDQPDTCPACGGKPKTVDNVVEAAIQRAYELGSQVEVATAWEKLEPIQNVGSIMYY